MVTLLPGFTPGNYTSLEQSWSMALKWLQDCLKNHTHCTKAADSTRRPTRLLDIGSNHLDRIRVVDTTHEDISGPYVTLSHCWGKIKPLRLLRSNLNQFMTEIAWQDLPLTFQHAISFTRYLKVRYLWIDSLCIIQDFDWLDDWYREVSLMQEVYQGSFLNLAADFAVDSTKGLFPDSLPRQIPIVHLPASTTPQAEYIRHVIWYVYLWDWEVEWSPLAARSWYVQERVLAPRILHFGKSQLFWECHEKRAAERHIVKEFAKLCEGCSRERGDEVLIKNFDWSGITKKDILEVIWPRIVYTFSKTDMSNPEDKLIALAGVSRNLGTIAGCRYLAGLWEESLVIQLCWQAMLAPEGLLPRPSTYRAPSFSWASVDAIVEWPDDKEYKTFAEVVEISTSPITTDMYGAVNDGYMILKSLLKSLSLTPEKNGKGFRVEIPGISIRPWPTAYMDSSGIEVKPGDIFFVFFLLVKTKWSDVFEGLVIQPTGTRGTFRRVGIVTMREVKPDLHQDLIKPVSDASTLPCISYDEASGKHTIRIV